MNVCNPLINWTYFVGMNNLNIHWMKYCKHKFVIFFQVRLAISDKRDVTIFVVQLFYSDMTQTLHETSSSLTNCSDKNENTRICCCMI